MPRTNPDAAADARVRSALAATRGTMPIWLVLGGAADKARALAIAKRLEGAVGRRDLVEIITEDEYRERLAAVRSRGHNEGRAQSDVLQRHEFARGNPRGDRRGPR